MIKNKVIAVMPIKLHNERLPGKNVMMLGNKPLICYELESLLSIQMLDEICVYCSSEDIITYLPEGVHFIKRSEKLDMPTANFTQIFSEFIRVKDANVYVYAHATAPFVTEDTIKECLDAVINKNFDSAFCATKIQDFLWKNGEPLNFNAENLPRSQDLEPVYRETSGVYVLKKEVFEKYHRRIGKNPYIKVVGYKEAIDINDINDFKIAEIFMNACI